MAQSTLDFISTFSTDQFKKHIDCSKIQVVRNPNTQKLFFITDNGIQGAVSNSVDLSNDPISISKCVDAEGEEMWMLHKENKSNVVAEF